MDNIKDYRIYLYDVYRKIILLAILAHSGYVLLCFMMSQSFLVIYNIGSVLFYVMMLQLAKKHFFKLTVVFIHLEVTLFVMVSVWKLGWESGFALLLIALISLVYVFPFAHSWISYLFSLFEGLIFIILKLITDQNRTTEIMQMDTRIRWFYLFNALAAFVIILYGSFVTNIYSNLREKKLSEENENLQAIAYYDQLTGCWTRYRMYESLKNGSIQPMYVALGDVDDFKQINDQYGHMCGDAVLLEIATIMKEDLFQKTAIIRWGGEEFVLLFEEDDEQAVFSQIEAVRKRIESHALSFQGKSFHVTMTFGISKIDQAVEEGIRIADIKMYEGKKKGKNQVHQ